MSNPPLPRTLEAAIIRLSDVLQAESKALRAFARIDECFASMEREVLARTAFRKPAGGNQHPMERE